MINQKNDPLTRGLYATDASMYQMQPLSVVTPRDRAEVLQIIREASIKNQPILARGAGTSLTGQSINEAIVVDFSKHLNQVLEINLEEGWVRVEPGIVCAELNAYLKPYGFHFAPDPATENRATIGGMIANNSAGMRSAIYGMTIDHVVALELALANGDVISLGPNASDAHPVDHDDNPRQTSITKELKALVEKHREEIALRYPKVLRRSGGYALDALITPNEWNPAKIICGSEGTLGIILEAKLKLTPLPKFSALCLAHFLTLEASLRAAETVVQAGASAAELIDGIIIEQARSHPLTKDICRQIQGKPAAIIVIELQDDDAQGVQERILRMSEMLSEVAYTAPVMTSLDEIQAVWQMRSSALGLMTTIRGPRKPTPYIEDAAVPPSVLADYVQEVLAVCEKYGQPVSVFGHASVGLVHIRPLHDLHKTSDIEQMKSIQSEVFPLVLKYGGSWSGEHGDGIVRGSYNRQFFGETLYEAFSEVKKLFDPGGRMNPGKIIDTPPVDGQLRYGASYAPLKISTQFHYREQGGILSAIEQCSGVGACRNTLSGTMCPSYMLTKDEINSTRGRANALRLVMSGQLGTNGLASDELTEALDLCLGCMGCKSECPNGVDMAKLKAEVLCARITSKGASLRARLFANLHRMSALAVGPQAALVNRLLNAKLFRSVIGASLGLDVNRQLPQFARQRLSHWFAQRPLMSGSTKTVVLFNDTYTEYFQPEVGTAAIEILEALGFKVQLATMGDSQRLAISQGMLKRAKKNGTELFNKLDMYAKPDTPILVCEPSCATALVHDLPDLIEDQSLANRVAKRVVMVDVFIERELSAGQVQFKWKQGVSGHLSPRFMVHSHCHQKVLGASRSSQMLLQRIPGAVVLETNAGCCGMAGSFGYETEHAGLSKQIADQRLMPSLEKEPISTMIVSNGFSCSSQISDMTKRTPLHVIKAFRQFVNIEEYH